MLIARLENTLLTAIRIRTLLGQRGICPHLSLLTGLTLPWPSRSSCWQAAGTPGRITDGAVYNGLGNWITLIAGRPVMDAADDELLLSANPADAQVAARVAPGVLGVGPGVGPDAASAASLAALRARHFNQYSGDASCRLTLAHHEDDGLIRQHPTVCSTRSVDLDGGQHMEVITSSRLP
ncbi:hypothetical protein ACFWP2_29290 [Kitasatospora sp. NPDC058444]|uniref:hypothetical protein n=1 Tax=Kitasatospora sp. NPDC058444 TaxID=3346504 RepID=UPI003653A2B3